MNQKIRKKVFRFIPFLIAGFFLSNLVLVKPAESLGPKFNYFPNDPKTLRVANSTRQTDWQTQTNASENEVVAFLFYYHNGVENTTAYNTKLRVDLPKTPNNSIKANAFLWADNTADVVTDTALILADKPLNIEYIPGTTKWYKEGSQTPITLPDNITSPSGVNIGNIPGCWPYAGYVVFQAKLVAPPQPQLAIVKKVANSNESAGTYNWQKQVSAKKGEIVAFNLFIYNPGNTDIDSLLIKDNLPQGLTYMPGSTYLYRDNEKIKLNDNVTSQGITINKLPYGISKGIYIVFKAKVEIDSNVRLTNEAWVKSGQLFVKDYAYINVVQISILNLSLEKTVLNESRNQTRFLKSTEATNSEIVKFRIVIKNTGNTLLQNINLIDYLPEGLIYQDNPQYQRTNTTLGWHWDSLAVGEEKTVYFKARVKEFNPGTYKLVNQANLTANSVPELIDEADVIVKITPPQPQEAKYLIDKKVLDVSKGDDLWLENNQAYAGDVLEYRIDFQNIGGKTEIVKITDDLPQSVAYIANSGKVWLNNQQKTFSTKLFTIEGLSFNLRPQDKGKIKFQVKIASNLQPGSSFKNCAYLQSPSMTLKDCSITTIKAKPEAVKPTPAVQELPPTGLTALFPFSLIFAFANYIWFERTRKRTFKNL